MFFNFYSILFKFKNYGSTSQESKDDSLEPEDKFIISTCINLPENQTWQKSLKHTYQIYFLKV